MGSQSGDDCDLKALAVEAMAGAQHRSPGLKLTPGNGSSDFSVEFGTE